MLEISRHIEYLLTEHDCVLVPGLGGFILQDISARLSADGNQWLAPTRSIVFNPALTYNDGLLAASLMKARSTDYHQATTFIDRDVATLRALLRKEGDRVAFGRLGDFILSDDNVLTFETNESYPLSLHSFGLAPLNIMPLRELTSPQQREKIIINTTEVKRRDNDVIHFTIRRRVAHRVMAIAATILLLFAVSLPLTNEPYDHDLATLAPTTMITPTVVADNQNTATPDGEFLIVVSTLTSRENALLKLQQFHNSGVTEPIFLFEDDNRVYLYTRTFTDRKAAFTYLRGELKNNTPFPDAWVMKVEK
ncbi:MAG: hypothetical protein IJY36_07725 [Coprobacter sp.]|nr:hypothetical protein [Coprobacter sp.]